MINSEMSDASNKEDSEEEELEEEETDVFYDHVDKTKCKAQEFKSKCNAIQSFPPDGQHFHIRSSKVSVKFAINAEGGISCLHEGCSSKLFGENKHSRSMSACQTHFQTHHSQVAEPQVQLSSFFVNTPSISAKKAAIKRREEAREECEVKKRSRLSSQDENDEDEDDDRTEGEGNRSRLHFSDEEKDEDDENENDAEAMANEGDVESEVMMEEIKSRLEKEMEKRWKNRCCGIPWFGEGEYGLGGNKNFALDYMWQAVEDIPWVIHTVKTAEGTKHLYLQSDECKNEEMDSSTICCHKCQGLRWNTKLINMKKNINKGLTRDNTKYNLKNIAQLRESLKQKDLKVNKLSLELQNLKRKALVAQSKLDDHKKILFLIRSNNIPRVNSILVAMYKKNGSAKKIIDTLNKALLGAYRVTQNRSDMELQVSELVKHLCPQLLFVLEKTHGLYSKSSVSRRMGGANMRRVEPCLYSTDRDIVMRNMRIALEGDENDCGWHLLIDETHVEETLSAGRESNILGACQCCEKFQGSLVLRTNKFTEAGVDRLCTAIKNGQVHYASGMTCLVLVPNRRFKNTPRFVLCMGTCKHIEGSYIEKLVELCLNVFAELSPQIGKGKGVILTVPSDGAPVMHASKEFIEQRICEPFMNNAGKQMSKLPLMPQVGGSMTHKRTSGQMDTKHGAKSIRTRTHNKIGLCLGDSKFLVDHFLKMFKNCKGLVEDQRWMNQIFMTEKGSADKQNVPATVKLFILLARLVDKSVDDYPPEMRDKPKFEEMLKDMQLLGHVAQCYLNLLLGKGLNVKGQLVNLSKLSHLLLVLYRDKGTKFIPAQNYSNTQRIIKGHYWSVLQSQDLGYKEYYFFLDSSDPLEQAFSRLRGLHGQAVNFSCLQAMDRLFALHRISDIFEKNPDWDKGSRRLKITFDHMNTKTVGSTKVYETISTLDGITY